MTMFPNWTAILEDLRARGWTQVKLAERIGCAQASISDLARGATTDPGYRFGEALLALHVSGKGPEAPQKRKAKA